MTADVLATTMGTLLDGRVRYEQPAEGFRTGIEPVFLAAAVPVAPGERVLEGGTGAGAVLICLAARVPGVIATGIECDRGLASVACRNVRPWPALTIHVGVVEDGIDTLPFDHACANPPWHGSANTQSPDPRRRQSKQAEPDTWRRWCGALTAMVRPGGSVTIILPWTRASLCAAELSRAGAGGGLVRPLLPKSGRVPKIALVQARRGASAPPRVLAGWTLHEDDGRYTPETDEILRHGGSLGWS